MKYEKGLILFCIIIMLFTSITYADTYSELIDKINIIIKQRQQREPVELELKGNQQIIQIYTTYIIKEKKPKKPKPPKPPKP